MSMSEGLTLVGASAPAGMEDVPLDLLGILEMDVSGLLDAELVERIKATYAIQALTGVLRAKYLREIRDRNFPITGAGTGGHPAARKGWPQWLGQVFPGIATADANREITGLEHLESAHKALPAAKDGDLTGGPAHLLPAPEINSTVLQELGRANGVGPVVAQKLLEGTAPATKRGVRAAVAEATSDRGKVGIKAKPLPAAPKAPAALPKSKPCTGNGRSLSLTKYGPLPEKDKELGYLKGSATANEKLDVALKELLRNASKGSTGKIARLQALAAALHREFKSIGDRYQGSWDSDSKYPDYMTLWQHVWAEEDTFHLHAELEAIRSDIAEAGKYFSIATMRMFSEDLEITT